MRINMISRIVPSDTIDLSPLWPALVLSEQDYN
jgi:hypothetical protein